MLKTAAKQYKFVLVGDSAVGKSSLLNRFVDKTYSESFMSTIGVDFKFRKIRIDNNDVKLQIWDTAGQQTFRSIVSAYYTSADAIVIVYDITSYDSFQNIKNYWITQAQNNNKNNAKIFLIGNKIDEESRRQVQQFTIDSFMEQHSIDALYQASAKTGQNVEQSFSQIARNLYFGVKSKQPAFKQPAKTSQQQNRASKPEMQYGSSHQKNQEPLEQPQEYEQVISVDEQVRKNEEKSKEQKIKINSQNAKKPKNPNYNKSCCLK